MGVLEYHNYVEFAWWLSPHQCTRCLNGIYASQILKRSTWSGRSFDSVILYFLRVRYILQKSTKQLFTFLTFLEESRAIPVAPWWMLSSGSVGLIAMVQVCLVLVHSNFRNLSYLTCFFCCFSYACLVAFCIPCSCVVYVQHLPHTPSVDFGSRATNLPWHKSTHSAASGMSLM